MSIDTFMENLNTMLSILVAVVFLWKWIKEEM